VYTTRCERDEQSLSMAKDRNDGDSFARLFTNERYVLIIRYLCGFV